MAFQKNDYLNTITGEQYNNNKMFVSVWKTFRIFRDEGKEVKCLEHISFKALEIMKDEYKQVIKYDIPKTKIKAFIKKMPYLA